MIDLLLQRRERVGHYDGGLLLEVYLLLHLDLPLLPLPDLVVPLLQYHLALVQVVDEVLPGAALHQPVLQRSDLNFEFLGLRLLLLYRGLGEDVFAFDAERVLFGCKGE